MILGQASRTFFLKQLNTLVPCLFAIFLLGFLIATPRSSLAEGRTRDEIIPLVGVPTDYTVRSNWMFLPKKATHDVDVFYFYPTVVSTASGAVVPINEEMKEGALSCYNTSASAFKDFANVYAPYYRQMSGENFVCMLKTGIDTNLLFTCSEVRTDAYAALDYYFKNCNNGRPVIFAGHSQGSIILKMILGEYMRAHPEYLKRMVATYALGFSISETWLQKNPHLKFAKGETDTGVIISWNTEGPGGTGKNIVLEKDSLNINPLNWKLDETPASSKRNKGGFTTDTRTPPVLADATIDSKRRVLVCTTIREYAHPLLFGDRSLHYYDWLLYYENIKENGRKRAEAFLGHPVR